MGVLQSISNPTSHVFMLVMTVFNVMFFIGVYFTAERYKSILFVMIANLLKLLSAVSYYIKGCSECFFIPALNSLLSALTITFMLSAIFTILRLKIKIWPFIVFNAAVLAQGMVLRLVNIEGTLVTAVSAFIIALMFVYAIIIIARNAEESELFNPKFVILILLLYVLFHTARGLVYMHGYMDILPNKKNILNGLSILCFGAYHIMNLMVIYLNYNYLMKKVRELSHRDKLTGALNRSIFFSILDVKIKELKRADSGFALAILDLDDFKQVNDTYGHLTGDEVLREFTQHLRSCLRMNDLICRYGGEEFLLLIEADDEDEARKVVVRIQKSMHDVTLTDKNISITFSCGLEYLKDHNGIDEVEELIKIIDERLYQAKNAGKDCLI